MEQQWENFLRFGENPKEDLKVFLNFLSEKKLIKAPFGELQDKKLHEEGIQEFICKYCIEEGDVFSVSLDREKSICSFRLVTANVLALSVLEMMEALKRELLV